MKKFNLITLFISVLFLGFAQETELANSTEFLEKITSISKETKTISADFVQEKSLDYIKDKQYSSGKFYTENGNMRWEQTKPSLYVMLMSDEGVKIKEDENENEYGAMAAKFINQIRGILLSSINGDFAENENFSPTYFENETQYIVKLKPENRKLSKMFKSIHLSFDKKTFRLKTLSFVQEDGISKMMFNNEEFNNELKATLFTQF